MAVAGRQLKKGVIKTRKLIKGRGFTDKLYFYNFVAVHTLMAAILAITALGGVLSLTDLSPLSNIPQWAYTELGIHTALIVWKAKEENSRKYRVGTDGKTKEDVKTMEAGIGQLESEEEE